MRQPPIVIHKGKKEEKYQLYVEDYVISFLKKEADRSDGRELNFYGCRDGRKYTVYGVRLDRQTSDFDKYDLLAEICCRITQKEPVFLIKEEHGTYEIKGYEVFYCENKEMQDYLIEQPGFRNNRAAKGQPVTQTVQREFFSGRERKKMYTGNPHVAVSLQLGLVFVVLVAIMINSTNSYDKMEQLNQSAKEVFFVMENQEAEEVREEYSDVSVERDESLQDTVLQDGTISDNIIQGDVSRDNSLQENILQENALQGQNGYEAGTVQDGLAGDNRNDELNMQAADVETDEAAAAQEGADMEQNNGTSKELTGEQGRQGDMTSSADGSGESAGETDSEAEEGVEALSRNVGRYYEVERGDTLYLISKKIYGDTSHVKKICELNQITNPDNIRYGQKIILP